MAIENLSIKSAPFSGAIGETLPAGTVELIITHNKGVALKTSNFYIGGAKLLGNDGSSYLWNTIGANVTKGITQVNFEPHGRNHVKAVVYHDPITIEKGQQNFLIDINWNPEEEVKVNEDLPIEEVVVEETPTPLPQGGSNPAISGLSISPKTLMPGSFQNVTATIKGDAAAEYIIVAYDSDGNYYNVEPEVNSLAYNDSFEKKARIENQTYTWSTSNNPENLTTKKMGRRMKSSIINIPKTTNANDVSLYFYVEPRGTTVLTKKCPSKENPIVRKNISEKTVTLTVLESVAGVTSTTTKDSDLTLKPNKKYKIQYSASGVEPDGCINFSIFLSHASAVVSSVSSFNIDDSFINVYKLVDGSYVLVDRGSDNEEYHTNLTQLGDFGISATARDITSATATCTISGKVFVKNIKNNSIKIEIDLDQIITTS